MQPQISLIFLGSVPASIFDLVLLPSLNNSNNLRIVTVSTCREYYPTRPSLNSEAETMYKLKGQSLNMHTGQSKTFVMHAALCNQSCRACFILRMILLMILMRYFLNLRPWLRMILKTSKF